MTRFGSVTGTGDITLPSGVYIVSAKLEAHPSNSGILYVKRRGDAGNGYPLSAGASIDIKGGVLSDYVASGVVAGQTLAYSYEQ